MSDGNNYNRDDDDEHNVSDGNDEDTRPVASRRRSERTRTPRPVETSTSARRIASRKNVSTKGRKALKGVLTAADRRRRRAGLVSSQAAGITSEDEDGDDAGGEDQLLSVADDDDSNNSDEDNGGEGPSRTRSLSIAGVSTHNLLTDIYTSADNSNPLLPVSMESSGSGLPRKYSGQVPQISLSKTLQHSCE